MSQELAKKSVLIALNFTDNQNNFVEVWNVELNNICIHQLYNISIVISLISIGRKSN